MDAWGAETSRSSQEQLQPHRYTSYERDGNGGDEAQQRRYQGEWTRFSQPDPSDGSYDITDPQSFNRYSYVENDPVNFVDPSGLDGCVLGPDGYHCWVDVAISFDDPSPDSFFFGLGGPFGERGIRRPITENELRRAERLPRDNETAPANDGVSDLNAGFGACGIASIAEHANQINGRWVGWTQSGPRTYSMSQAGNQYVSRSAALNNASAFRALGRVSFIGSSIISGAQGYQAIGRGDYQSAGKSGLDIGMGALGTFGGPPGAAISTGYFAVDLTIGWGRVAVMEQNSFQTQRAANGQGLCIYSGMTK